MPDTTILKRHLPIRYFAVTYYDGDHSLGDHRQSVFRSKRLTRAKRIARSNMPMDADRMELVEINRIEFDDHREAYRQRYRMALPRAVE